MGQAESVQDWWFYGGRSGQSTVTIRGITADRGRTPEPVLTAGLRIALMPDPASAQAASSASNTTIAHIDAATARLIVGWPSVEGQPTGVEQGSTLLVLLAQPGDGLYARPFLVEKLQAPAGQAAGWLVLRPIDTWQRIDRRRAERVVVTIPAQHARWLPTSGGSVRCEAVVRDLSEGGVLVEAPKRLGLGDWIEFDLALPDGEPPFAVRAKVMRVQQTRMDEPTWLAGCQMEAVAPAERARILRFVAEHQRLRSE
jgi:hypothetical protein